MPAMSHVAQHRGEGAWPRNPGRAPGRHRAAQGAAKASEPADTQPGRHRAPRASSGRRAAPPAPVRKAAPKGARAQLADRATRVPPNTNPPRGRQGARVTPLTDRPDRLGNVPRRTRDPWYPPTRQQLAARRPVMGQPSVSEERTRHAYAAHRPKPATVRGRARRSASPLPGEREPVKRGRRQPKAEGQRFAGGWFFGDGSRSAS